MSEVWHRASVAGDACRPTPEPSFVEALSWARAMTASSRPTYQAIVDQALAITGASTGWLLRYTNDQLVVMAASGTAARSVAPGTIVEATGATGYVLSSGRPVALMPQTSDASNDGAAGYPGVPPALLAAPCGADEALGVLELAAESSAGPFTFAHLESVSALAAIAGAALLEDDGTEPDVVSPSELAEGLERLAADSPARYAAVARATQTLLDRWA